MWFAGPDPHCSRSTMMARDQAPPVFDPLAVRLSVWTAVLALSGKTLT